MFWENSIETNILSNVKQIASPGWMHETSAQGWCTGKTRGMEWGGRWERGSGWGTHENPWLIHVNVWQKPLQYSKIISLQLIKINEKKSSCLSPTEIGWNLGPFAAVLEPGQMSLQATKYKETSETKIWLCACTDGANYEHNIKVLKTPSTTSEESGAKIGGWEQKQSNANVPCTQHHERCGQTT